MVKKRDKEIWVTDGNTSKQFSKTMVITDPGDSSDRELRRLLEGFQQFQSGRMPGVLLTKIVHPSEPDGKKRSSIPREPMCGLF